ncbi:MAG: hypothetical protein IT301_09180, partial [Dehalococcoidia bacterium]|nr:hypothetical protein [Dehalococcoidia bacterium]
MATYQTNTDPSETAPADAAMKPRPAAFRSWLRDGLLPPEAIKSQFESQESRSGPLTRAYLVTAMVWCFFVCWPTTYVELGGIPLAAAFIAHAFRTPRFFLGSIAQPVFVFFTLYWAWTGASLAWSADVRLGLTQVGCARWLWVFPALWPALGRRRWLVFALVLGFLAGNLSQVF